MSLFVGRRRYLGPPSRVSKSRLRVSDAERGDKLLASALKRFEPETSLHEASQKLAVASSKSSGRAFLTSVLSAAAGAGALLCAGSMLPAALGVGAALGASYAIKKSFDASLDRKSYDQANQKLGYVALPNEESNGLLSKVKKFFTPTTPGGKVLKNIATGAAAGFASAAAVSAAAMASPFLAVGVAAGLMVGGGIQGARVMGKTIDPAMGFMTGVGIMAVCIGTGAFSGPIAHSLIGGLHGASYGATSFLKYMR